MEPNKFKKIRVPRETLIQGKLTGKYRSELDASRSYTDLEKYYILHVYECEISKGEPIKEDDFELREKLNKNIYLQQPVKLSATVNDELKLFMVSFKSYEIENPVLYNVVSEGQYSFGSIKAKIKGIVEDHKEIEVPVEDIKPTGKTEEKIEDGEHYEQREYVYMHNGQPVYYYGDWIKTRKAPVVPQTHISTPASEKHTIPSAPVPQSNRRVSSFITRSFFGLIGILLLLAGLRFLWPFALLFGLFWLLRFTALRFPSFGNFARRSFSSGGRFASRLLPLLSLLFWGFVIYSLFNLHSCRTEQPRMRKDHEQTGERKQRFKKGSSADDEGSQRDRDNEHDENDNNDEHDDQREDSNENVPHHNDRYRPGNSRDHHKKNGPNEWISHPFTWNDYRSNEYSGYLAVRKRDYARSEDQRNSITTNAVFPENYWNSIYNRLSIHDNKGLDSICRMFDMIRKERNLDARAFADVIVSCIQHMPYELIMEGSCNPSDYDRPFIREYMGNGGKCNCCSRFGLYTPVEYAGNFAGDCDTRTLTLFTILTRFGYDAMILNSDVHGHSVLGVNLPSRGVSRDFNGRRYFVWETTAKGMELGQFPAHMSDMNTWYIALTNNN